MDEVTGSSPVGSTKSAWKTKDRVAPRYTAGMKYTIVLLVAIFLSVPFSSHACLPKAGQGVETKAASGLITIAGSSLSQVTGLEDYTLIYQGSQNSCGRTEVYVHTNAAIALGAVAVLVTLLIAIRRRHSAPH
jgi:hypothetical protein